ncbi:MAG: DUF2125 domain-containing protein [Paracoccaceae bacterium]
MRDAHILRRAPARLLAAAAFAALAFGGTAARADLTADQVWQSWSDYYSSLGQEITSAASERQGDTLVVSGVAMTAKMPTGSYSAAFGDVRLRELGDGRVEISFAPEVPITLNNTAESGETVDMGMRMMQTGMSVVASGTPEALSYDVAAPDVRFGIDKMTVDGAEVPMQATVAMTGGAGTHKVTSGGARAVSSSFTADALSFDVAAKNPEGEGNFTAKGNMAGISGMSDATMPEGIDMTDMKAALAAGFGLTSGLTFGSGSYSVDFNDAGKTMTANVEAGGGNLDIALSKAGLVYGGGGKAAKISVVASDLPFPVDLAYAETGFNLTMPLSQSDAAQPVAFLVKVIDLTVSEAIWGMIDAGNQLPHDPATVILDVSGMAKLMVDLFDPAVAESPAPPGQIDQVTLNQLLVRLAGAELTGSGAVNVDNSAGMPAPVGAVDLQLTGGNKLLDTLASMGLIPPDQVMGAKMMLGLFAVPTGEDVLTSKIEFKEDGGIYANGQRVQ